MTNFIIVNNNGEFIVIAHACPGAMGKFQWYLVDDPNSDKKRNIAGQVHESFIISSDKIDKKYKDKWLCCKCEVSGEEYNEGCLLLKDNLVEIIGSNPFDSVKFFGADGNIQDDIEYCVISK